VPNGYFKDQSGNCVVDQCPNIDGGQATVPNGYFKDQSGNCVVDQCPNIDGGQATVPDGYFKDQQGNCVVDQCPNIDGGQATVPEGMIVVEGQCVTPNCENSPEYAEEHAAECNPCQYDDSIPATDPNCRLIEVCVDGKVAEYPASQAPQDTEDCGQVQVCVNGEFVTATEYEVNKGIVVDTEDCGSIRICVDGHFVTVPEHDAPSGTGDCDPIRVCVDGQNYSVTEFEQQKGNLQTGDCIPYEPPTPPTPPTTPPTVTTPPAPVQQVAAAVSEVLPARLPSAGMGPDETSSSFSWGAAAAVVLLGLGGMTALMARRQER
jgi:hypothetical protein